jgi:hypothetical protein
VEQARKLDPVSPAMNAYVGLPLFFARRYDQIIERLLPLAEAYPEYHHPHAFLALAYEQKRDYGRAITRRQQAQQRSAAIRGSPIPAIWRGPRKHRKCVVLRICSKWML